MNTKTADKIAKVFKANNMMHRKTYSIGEMEMLAKEANVDMFEIMWFARYEMRKYR